MDERNHATPRSWELDRPSSSRAAREEALLEQAVEILQARYQVGATSAYMILVQASADSRLNLREAAWLIITGNSPGTI